MRLEQEGLTDNSRVQASEQFRRLQGQATLSRLWATLTRQQQGLLNLTAVEKNSKVQHRAHAGIQLVPIDKIRGSENRCEDFDSSFRPLRGHNRDRWVAVAVAHKRELPLPAVELVQLNGVYFVRDGHHRISVAKSFGQLEIEAQVTVWHGATNELL